MVVLILTTLPGMASCFENTKSTSSSAKCCQTWWHISYPDYLKFLGEKVIETHSFDPLLTM